MILDAELSEGARNLLINCANVTRDMRILIVCEDPTLGWYDRTGPAAVEIIARDLGLDVTTITCGPPGNDRDPSIDEAIAKHDCIIFFARIGDQDRFSDPPAGTTWVMSYARTAWMLASAYGRTDHLAMVDVKNAVDKVLQDSTTIEISCPLGTSVQGHPKQSSKNPTSATRDTGIRRFPLGVPQPVSAADFSGEVIIARYLTPTGSGVYEPPSLQLESQVCAVVNNGHIIEFTGDTTEVKRVEAHYRSVAKLFATDPWVVHSWHAGIHPACAINEGVDDNPDRWSNSVFTHPRFLHFHTCGDYAPGEICWMIMDPTVTVEGQPLWCQGQINLDGFDATRESLARWPILKSLMKNPSPFIGL
ncbi:MAG: hypothetical protein DHS20C01_13430 [marine bacterium B5-7]|nr:MAG: hypothetical protein DHS20C01_13430 [marine bacterium B5-7]